jgi:hypothetical protein
MKHDKGAKQAYSPILEMKSKGFRAAAGAIRLYITKDGVDGVRGATSGFEFMRS